jgi:hypothetical protein
MKQVTLTAFTCNKCSRDLSRDSYYCLACYLGQHSPKHKIIYLCRKCMKKNFMNNLYQHAEYLSVSKIYKCFVCSIETGIEDNAFVIIYYMQKNTRSADDKHMNYRRKKIPICKQCFCDGGGQEIVDLIHGLVTSK